MNTIIVSFLVCLLLLTGTGAMAWVKKKKTNEDYLIASRGVAPWLSALSTVATNNSGFMFIGMIGYTYRSGLESLWMMAGWVLGDLVTWSQIHPRVRRASGLVKVNTLTSLLGTWKGETIRPIIMAASIVTFVFLGIYAAAQLKAGSTALHALFGWELWTGVVIGAAIVVLYSFAGGIRADIWTDAAQSFAMIGAMVMIIIAGAMDLGGPRVLYESLQQQDASLVSLYPENLRFGLLAFVAGYFFAGIGTIGQPHLMTRLLSIESVESVREARTWYFVYYVPFFLASILVGLYCRGILPDLDQMEIARQVNNPTELALPLLTLELLPDIFVGIALAGLFAATVSTADSQVIICSGSITQELIPELKDSYVASKAATFSITLVATLIAIYAPEDVFGLVLIAWSALGACLGPILVVRLFQLPLNAAAGLSMMAVAFAIVVYWHFSGWDDDVLKIFPGMVAAFLVYGVFYLWFRRQGQPAV